MTSLFAEAPEPTEADQDRTTRLTASPQQLSVARAMLSADPEADVVICPVALPGKPRGTWPRGQAVEHPGGFWLATSHDTSEARHDADRAAAEWLKRHRAREGGMSGWIVIYLDGAAAVFEGISVDPT